MRKLLGKPTQDHTYSSTLEVASSTSTASSPTFPQLPRSAAPQNTSFEAGGPIDAIDIAPDGASLVLAGRHILKTVQLDGASFRDGIDLRAAITSQPWAKKAVGLGSAADQLSIRDVKWSRGTGEASIYTACANGKIFRYDMAHGAITAGGGMSASELIQIREDSRQINTLDINPHRNTYLLSGSQDGFVMCFDIRQSFSENGSLPLRASKAFKCNAEGVRHVKWSPRDGFLFACATDAGMLLKWDIRKPNAPLLRINAHDKACTSLDWHPDGDHVVTGGWDGKCHVWDLSRLDKRQKARWTITGPAPISVVRWRPAQWSATAQARRAAQVAVAYDENSQRRHGVGVVHIWDFARPSLPFKEISMQSDRSPSALLWHDQDQLWTAGQDGFLVRSDVGYAPNVVDRQIFSAFNFSSRSALLMFLDERPRKTRVRPQAIYPHAIEQPATVAYSYSSSPATPKVSGSRSDSDDDLLANFLAPKRKGSRRRRPSTRSTRSLSTTPPTIAALPDGEMLTLDGALNMTGIYKTQQAMAVGHVPTGLNAAAYEYMSVNYIEILHRDLPANLNQAYVSPLIDRVATIMEKFARAAETISQFRLAQTWRILGYAMRLLLARRAQFHYEKRMAKVHAALLSTTKVGTLEPRTRTGSAVRLEELLRSGEVTPRRQETQVSRGLTARSLLAEEIESTSNVPTPLARPVDQAVAGLPSAEYVHNAGKRLTPVSESESFSLGPAIVSISPEARRRLDSMPLSTTSRDSGETQSSNTEGYDFYDLDAGTTAIDVPKKRRTPPPPVIGAGLLASAGQAMQRHDSGESFSQMFSVSDGSKPPSVKNVSQQREVKESEYESRVRGRTIQDESPERSRIPPPRLLASSERQQQEVTSIGLQHGDAEDVPLTQATDEHHLITQTTASWSPESRRTIPEVQSRADVGRRPSDAVGSYRDIQQESFPSSPPRSDIGDVDDDSADHIIEADYLPWDEDPPYPHPVSSSKFSLASTSALDPPSLVRRTLAFETRSSALNASAIILLLKPLMPAGIVDDLQATAILRQHHARLMSLKLFVEAALLRQMCVKGWPGKPLTNWGDTYPSIYAPAQLDVAVGFLCPTCGKPLEIDPASSNPVVGRPGIWQCKRCAAVMAPCAVCGHRDTTVNTLPSHPPEDENAILTWWYCPTCRHGGHSTCMMGWHEAYADSAAGDSHYLEMSGGCCPLDGCGHACLPGPWRNESGAVRSELLSRVAMQEARETEAAVPHTLTRPNVDDTNQSSVMAAREAGSLESTVRADGLDIPVSRAVESVRSTLAEGGSRGYGSRLSSESIRGSLAAGVPMRRTLSSSPGGGRGNLAGLAGALGLGDRERRKSVKFAGTGDGDEAK